MDFVVFGVHIHVEKVFFVAIIVLVIISATITGFILSKNNNQIVINKSDTEQNDSTSGSKSINDSDETSVISDNNDKTTKEKIKVYVVGCVKKPGIVEIYKGQIISDAIKKAGGPTKNADIRNINMVYKLLDNVMLRINKKGSNNTSKDLNSTVSGKGVAVITDAGNAEINGSKSGSKKGGLININTATASELDELPGVGEKTAADIIEYRKNAGGFTKIEELMNVSRIGQKRFDSIKSLITV